MILIYRPELQNPPMAKESTIGFSFIGTAGHTTYIDVEAGVNRDFPVETWEKIKGYDFVESLLNLGSLVVKEDEVEAQEQQPASKKSTDSISGMGLQDAMQLVENSFDIDQLNRWDAKDQRIRVKQAIQRRITAIQEGKG